MSSLPLHGLVSCGIIEKDVYKDILWTWSYPVSSEDERKIVMQKCPFNNSLEEDGSFIYFQFDNTWYYVWCRAFNSESIPKVQQVALMVSSRDFNPTKYSALCDLMLEKYESSASPANVLNVFLCVATTGQSSSTDNGVYSAADYDPRLPFITAPVKSTIRTFGIETILLYVGVVLKRKVIVYHPELNELLDIARSIPALALPRQDWTCLHPYLSTSELSNLSNLSHYVAGFTDPSVKDRSVEYDLFIDSLSAEIHINPATREYFGLGSMMKTIAQMMVDMAESDESTDQLILKEVAKKTKEMLNKLKTFTNESGEVTLESIKATGLGSSAVNFFFNLGVAEGIVRL